MSALELTHHTDHSQAQGASHQQLIKACADWFTASHHLQLARKARREAGAASGLRALNPNVKVPSFLWADLWLGFVHLFTTSSIIMRVNPGSTTPD